MLILYKCGIIQFSSMLEINVLFSCPKVMDATDSVPFIDTDYFKFTYGDKIGERFIKFPVYN